MKETRYFYTPSPLTSPFLPEEEAAHVLPVLRLGVGDGMTIIHGVGNLHQAAITSTQGKRCQFEILSTVRMAPEWTRRIHIAMAPTKNIDRTEWFVEKATEIGVDHISLLECQFSERKVVKAERLEKIVISAMKQSHKFYKPQVEEMQPFARFINQPFDGPRFIAHCYDQPDLLLPDGTKPLLSDLLRDASSEAPQGFQVLVGPEGDFSVSECRQALQAGFIPVSLGTSRLRTETAALVAVHLMRLNVG